MGFCEPITDIHITGDKASQSVFKMFQRKPVVGQYEQIEKDLELEYTKFNDGFKVRDDVNKHDLLLLSSVDLEFDTKKNKLRRTQDLQELVALKTSYLAIVSKTPDRSKDTSKVDLIAEEKRTKLPFIEMIVDPAKAAQIQNQPSYDGFRKLYVYFVCSLK